MLQLCYISTSRSPVDQKLLDDILAASRRNNARCGVTGLLVSGGKRFIQVLEGPDQSVLTSYARIQNDPRHFAIVLLANHQTGERAFGQWSMAHQAGRGGDLTTLVNDLTANVTNRSLKAQFNGFAELHSKAA